MSSEHITETENAVALYEASFTSGLAKGAQRWLGAWLQKDSVRPVNASRFREALDFYVRSSEYNRPPIRAVTARYEKLQEIAERVRNETFCVQCSNTGMASYLTVRVGNHSYPVCMPTEQGKSLWFQRNVRGMWRPFDITPAHAVYQAVAPCGCRKGQDYARRAAMPRQAREYIARHCIPRQEGLASSRLVEGWLDWLYADRRAKALKGKANGMSAEDRALLERAAKRLCQQYEAKQLEAM